jgi:hypothetical protein
MKPTGWPRERWLSLVFKGIENRGRDLEEIEQQKESERARSANPTHIKGNSARIGSKSNVNVM